MDNGGDFNIFNEWHDRRRITLCEGDLPAYADGPFTACFSPASLAG